MCPAPPPTGAVAGVWAPFVLNVEGGFAGGEVLNTGSRARARIVRCCAAVVDRHRSRKNRYWIMIGKCGIDEDAVSLAGKASMLDQVR